MPRRGRHEGNWAGVGNKKAEVVGFCPRGSEVWDLREVRGEGLSEIDISHKSSGHN